MDAQQFNIPNKNILSFQTLKVHVTCCHLDFHYHCFPLTKGKGLYIFKVHF